MQLLEVSKLQQLKLVEDERQMQKLPSSSRWPALPPPTSSLPTPAQAKGRSAGAAPLSLDRKMKEKDKERKMLGKTGKKAEWM